jgi:hypothetical protein
MGILHVKILDKIKAFIAENGGVDEVVKQEILIGSRSTLFRATKEDKLPGGDTLLSWLETLNAKIIFPGDPCLSKCATKEAAAVDAAILAMRGAGMAEPAVRAGAVNELDSQFEKKCSPESTEQTKRAS